MDIVSNHCEYVLGNTIIKNMYESQVFMYLKGANNTSMQYKLYIKFNWPRRLPLWVVSK